MLVALGFLMIGTFMFLIMTKKLTPVAALIIVPTVFGLIAGAGLGLGDMVMEAITDLAPTAALLMFAIIYFGIMIDVGLFDPLIRFVLRVFGDDPAKVVVGTAVLAGAVSLDGDGSTTFIVTTSALLPVYLRMGLSPVVLTCVAGLANGVLNVVPWGGPTARAASALGLEPTDIFVPMIPSVLAGLGVVLVFAWLLGLSERRRLRAAGTSMAAPVAVGAAARPGGAGAPAGGGSGGAPGVGGSERGMADTALDPDRPTLRPRLIWFNLALTAAIMVLLVLEPMPIPTLFMIGCAIALVVNFRHVSDQLKELSAHGSSVVSVVAMVMAAGVLTGVLNGTGMVDAMSRWLVGVIPDAMGPYLAVITGLLSLPGTFFMSNDAFYFGILPVLTETAANYGITPVEMARASIVGQPVHMQSPLVPAILLLVSLAKVDLGDHHKKVLWRAAVASLAMLAVGVLTTVIPLG
ncbi:CitMHS family transporter [Marinitenerispora sediminis]|uniref:Citrate:proton symporter n=1 Tax=Marinitenerispora sediminis TaxID=1931232 RepID=A0A368TBE6_9ACTN|nr:SLC13 family permease [Marinitenerispora sediminis]RCV48476.1 citrate:proton symporter [Marinitenerispora sediminis]RCV50046.1 citrate:proton symporter [Marinitenerispora sediminis]RCV62469.1 citrate:proton symporter [Marinitenerispora sediminis]